MLKLLLLSKALVFLQMGLSELKLNTSKHGHMTNMSNVKNLFVLNLNLNTVFMAVLITIKPPWNVLVLYIPRNANTLFVTSLVLIILYLMLLILKTPSLPLIRFKINASFKQNNLLFVLLNSILFFTLLLLG